MNNCLVTRLNTVIDDYNMDYLYGFSLNVKANTECSVQLSTYSEPLYIYYNTECVTLTYDDDGTAFKNPLTNISSVRKINIYSTIDTSLKIVSYKNIQDILTSGSFNVMDINQICKVATYIDFRNITVNCNTEYFKNNTNLIHVCVYGSNVIGKLSDFGYCLKLNTLEILNTKISGSIESLVQSFRDNGRIAGRIDIGWVYANQNLTFNGSVFSITGSTKALIWTQTTITFLEQTIEA